MGRRRVAATVVATALLAVGAGERAVAQEPSAALDIGFAPGSPAPPVLNQSYGYALQVGNDGDVPLEGMTAILTLPVEIDVASATTGRYTGLADVAPGEGVRVSYEKNTAPGVFTLWGSSPNASFDTTLTAPPPGLGAGEYLTRVRWQYGQAAPGMQASAPPLLSGRVTNPDRTGGPVAVGDTVQACATLTAAGAPGPLNACETFALIAGPAVAIGAPNSAPLGSAVQATATLTGGAPTGAVTFQVFAANTACATALLDEDVPVNGARAYEGPDFTAAAAGAYQWVARYGGDALHAAGATGCDDPAGAFAVVAPPAVSASFGTAAIAVGESTALTFTITNPAANTVALTGVALENTLPDGLAVASPSGLSGSCGAGTITAAPGAESVTLEDGTIPMGSSCSFSVTVTASAAGPVTNTTDAVQSANGGAGNSASASLTVRPPTPPNPPTAPNPIPVAPPTLTAPPALPRPVAPRTAQELALACAPASLVLDAATGERRRVRFRGVAGPADAGQQVTIRTRPGGTLVARATVLPDGSFAATGPPPRRRAVNTTRYYAELGARRSMPLKFTRRLTARLTEGASAVTISGRVAPPLGRPIRRVLIKRLTSCAAGYEVVASVTPSRSGRFRVSLARTPDSGPALYRAHTQARTKGGGALGTLSLVLAEA